MHSSNFFDREISTFVHPEIKPLNELYLIELITLYQSLLSPWEETNYNGKHYSNWNLIKKIETLYKIGHASQIISTYNKFDDSTKVTQRNQEICNLVCKWVEEHLGIELLAINVYEPLIEDYKLYRHRQVKYLKEIGVRAGILRQQENEDKISATDAQITINWIENQYGIQLPFPDPRQVKSHNSKEQKNVLGNQANTFSEVRAFCCGILVTFILLILVNQFSDSLPKKHLVREFLKLGSELLKNSTPAQVYPGEIQ